MTYILTCGCKSEYGGFPCEWDSETRECEPAIAYGSLCEKHYAEYDARPAQYDEPQQFFDKVRDISVALDKGTYCNGFCGVEECKENQANCKRLTQTVNRLTVQNPAMTIQFVKLPWFAGKLFYWDEAKFNGGDIYYGYRFLCLSLRIRKYNNK